MCDHEGTEGLDSAGRVAMCAAVLGFGLMAPAGWSGPAQAAPHKTVKAAPPSLCPHIPPSKVSIVGYQVVLNTSAGFRGLCSCLYKILR